MCKAVPKDRRSVRDLCAWLHQRGKVRDRLTLEKKGRGRGEGESYVRTVSKTKVRKHAMHNCGYYANPQQHHWNVSYKLSQAVQITVPGCWLLNMHLVVPDHK